MKDWMRLFGLGVVMVSLLAAGCNTSPSAQTPEAPASAAAKLPMVEVSKEGTRFDPAVEKEQVPAGAWICDMGTVEYARTEKGDGKCPVCGMMLKEHKH